MTDQQTATETAGHIFHHEIRSSDPGSSREFFSTVFGWTFTLMEVPGADVSMFETPGRGEGHLMAPEDGAGPSVTGYIVVDDIDATAQAIDQAGGRIVIARQEAPNMGSYLTFEAPGGPTFVAWQHARL